MKGLSTGRCPGQLQSEADPDRRPLGYEKMWKCKRPAAHSRMSRYLRTLSFLVFIKFHVFYDPTVYCCDSVVIYLGPVSPTQVNCTVS